MKKLLKTSIALVFVFTTAFCHAQKKSNVSVNKKGIAVKGFDLVSYFDDAPIKGDMKYSVEYNNAKYLFSNKKNLKKFKKNPDKYLPQYGGYCSFAMGKGYKYGINPHNYLIKDNKLYFFYGKPTNNMSKKWINKNLKIPADKNWNKLQ